MRNSIEIRTGRHCTFSLHVHLVFVTKYRRKIFNGQHFVYLKDLFQKLANMFEAELVEFNGEYDHVHLLLNYHPKISISKLVNSFKGVSSRRLRQHFPELQQYYFKDVLWSPSYFASSCGGAPISIIRKYIEQQSAPV